MKKQGLKILKFDKRKKKNDITFIEILKEHVEDKYKTNRVSARTYLRDFENIKQIEKTCGGILNMPIRKITSYNVRAVYRT